MKRQYYIGITLIAMVVMMLSSCASLQGRTQQPLTAKQQATIWLGIYNAQYDDTLSIMSNPSSTAAQLKIARQKKAVLTDIWPLLKVYITVIDRGGVPTTADTVQLTGLINDLTSLAGGK